MVSDDVLDEREVVVWSFQQTQFQAAYGEDEPEYTLDMIREPNPEYKPVNASCRRKYWLYLT